MKRSLLIAEFMATPWALMPERLAAFGALLARWHAGERPSAADLATVESDKQARAARAAPAASGGIAVLNMFGVISQRANMADDISGPGGTSTEMVTKAFRQLMADPSVGGVVLNIDSPGGGVYGVGELADEIYQARGSKPVMAVANSLAASAAYWLGSAASEFYVTPGGEVGSIGVWMAHQDVSQMYEAAGVKMTLISAGKFKTEGNAYEPLGDEARSFLQSRVDDYYAAFVKGVARGRGVGVADVRDNMGQGRVFGAQDALAANMVDGIDTLDGVIGRVAKALRKPAASNRAAAERRLRLIE